jgi:hypothetical protein
MAPAPGSGHTDDDPVSSTAMASPDYHQNGANATPSSSTIPPMPSSFYGNLPQSLTPVTVTTDYDWGMITVVLMDANGHSVFQYATPLPGYKDGGHGSTTTSPYKESSPTISSNYQTNNPTALSSGVTQSSQSPQPFSEGSDHGEHHKPPFPVVVAMGIIIPAILVILSCCAFFFCIKKKRKTAANQQELESAAARRVPEMKSQGVGGGPIPNMMSARAVGGSPSASGAIVSPVPSPTSASSAATGSGTPPVILSTTMNDAYYTGIDTSDHISLTDQRSEASVDTFGEEPPPPYRPRSVPPISRETSVRNSMCRNTSVRSSRHDPMSGSNLMGGHVRRSVDVRSPFDDPEDSDDDNLSQISTIRSLPRRDTDRLSVVSDISYQEEPTHTHSAV